MALLERFYRYASPAVFYRFAGAVLPWVAGITLALMGWGLYLGLFVAPPDYQQGDSFRIMYVHVPAAWMSLFVYVVMAAAGATALIWRVKVAEMLASASAPIGAAFTFIALVTGSLWGKPMWGTYWVWDARLTSELILLFLYLGFMALESAIEDPRRAARACGLLAVVGVVNVPIIHFSVEWWNTLHQGPSVSRLDAPAIHPSMLRPLLLMALAFQLFYFWCLLLRVRALLLEREAGSQWVRDALRQ